VVGSPPRPAGSAPSEAAVRDHGSAAVAQLAEQRTFNPKVVGSIPTGGIEKYLQIGGFWLVRIRRIRNHVPNMSPDARTVCA
jgi:hypothetical protein